MESILEKNWDSIVSKVIDPLWNNEFNYKYESLKLDYDDFVSLCGYELTKAFINFDGKKSNLYTFATNVIKRKAKTELRNWGNRNKRRSLSSASSLNEMAFDGRQEEVLDRLQTEREGYPVDSELTEKRVGNFVNSLSNQQLRVLILSLLGFDASDMPEMLQIPTNTMRDILNGLKSSDLTRILYRRKF